ncbi:DNA repair protein [Neoconidiobolus thromboides FSU 785]|nr:DNA repair protein [Neoconidiobolus thromboides FSU 785]
MSETDNKKTSSINKVPTSSKRIQRSDYIDYDLSKMVDSKGGFLIEEENPQVKLNQVEPILLKDIPEDNDRCKECQKLGVDPLFFQLFKVSVCSDCKKSVTEKYSLLTKTEVKEDYLLTEDELRDKDLFNCWSKPNPRKSSWNNMLLYLREQVEMYAYKKWGGSEGLDAELERREMVKKKKKADKFKNKLKDLRKRTRTETWEQQRPKIQVHEHQFIQGETEGKCTICGLKVEMETF